MTDGRPRKRWCAWGPYPAPGATGRMTFNSDALLTDLYELTMAQAYLARDMTQEAVFEFFVRQLPPRRNFFMAAGLDQVLSYLEGFHFSDEDLDYLDRAGGFTPAFLTTLKTIRFTGAVHAMPEGALFFPNEPILRITAP